MIRAICDYQKLKKHQLKSSESHIKAYQFKQIKKMVAYAKKHSAFYRDLYDGFPLNNIDDFHQLPTIDKTIMMQNFSTLNTEGLELEEVMAFALKKEADKDYLGYFKDRFVVGLSSGTSGNKGIFVTPKKMTKRLPAVFLARSGLSLKALPFRILFLLRVFSQGFEDINAPFIHLRYLTTMTDPMIIIETMIKEQINILMAPPSMLRVLLPYADQMRVKLKKIITYAEVLTPADKSQFEKAFDASVIEIYQASEGQIASACPEGHLHINEDLVYVELYDEHHQLITKPGVIGKEMIITNLVNQTQPLIRYRMNDMIVLDEPCKCGSSFRRIRSILGRRDDVFFFHDENKQWTPLFPDLFSRFIITYSDQIREFQVTQTSYGQAHIDLDAQGPFDIDAFLSHIHERMASYHLNGHFDVTIKKIELPKDNGKFKRFIQTSHPSIDDLGD